VDGWHECKLGDLFEIKHGFAFKGEYFSDEGPYVLLTPGNFREEGGLKLKGYKEKFYTGKFPSEFLLKRGDLLVAMTDLTQTAPILGSPAFIPEDDRFLHNQRLGKIINIAQGKIVAKFLFYLLNSTSVRGQIKGSATGATVRHTSPSRIYDVAVQIPAVSVQRHIAGILSAYDELIENSQRRIKILESMARALYREWFVHFRFPGHESIPLIPSPLGEIPKGWEVKKLGEIAEEMRRNVPKGNLHKPQPYVGLEHIPRRSLALDAWETTTDLGSNKLEFKKGEVLFGKIRPYFHKVSVAPFDGLCSADTIVIRARRPEYHALVVACVSSDDFVAHATATSNGSKMPRANWGILEECRIAIPKGRVAAQFSALVADIIDQQQALIFQIQNLRHTRDLLLPRLLSGQIEVANLARPVPT
jgi:type I restriction enzyme S subunit